MSWLLMTWLLIFALKNAILALPLAALALVATRWLRRPALAHLLWAIVLLKLITPPLVDVPVGWKLNVERWLGQASGEGAARGDREGPPRQSPWATPVVTADAPRVGAAMPSRATAAGSASASWSRSAPTADAASGARHARLPVASPPRTPWNISWTHLAGMVWIAGSMVMLAILARRAWRFRGFIRLATQRDEHLGVRVAELAHTAGVTIPPKVIIVDGIVSPMLWGLGNGARLIFPGRLAKRLSPAELDTLLLHELAHFARRDHWLRVLEMAACVLYWWHPLVWWARRKIERAEEECCDAWVVERQAGHRHSYAEALLTAVDFLCEPREALPPAACGLGEVTLLRARLTQIMSGGTTARLSRRGQALVLVGGLLLSPLEPALWATSSPRSRAVPAAKSSPAAKADVGLRSAGSDSSDALGAASSGSELSAASPSTVEPLRSLIANALTAPPSPPSVVLWAAAVSSDGKFRIEARTGRKAQLLRANSDWRLDLSTYEITCVSFAPNGRTFATGHSNAAVRLWDSQTGGFMRSYRGADAAITSVQVSPDGRSVAAGSSDGGAMVWDLTTGDETARLPQQNSPVSCLRWSKRGDRLAIALGAWWHGDEVTLAIWTPGKTVTRRNLEGPVGAIDWLGEDEALVIAAWSGRCQLWNVAAGKATGGFLVEKDQVSAAAWSADCPLISRWLADQLVGRARE